MKTMAWHGMALLALILILCVGCSADNPGTDDDDDALVGTEGNPCYEDGTCLGLLVCENDLCTKQVVVVDGDELEQEERCNTDDQCPAGMICEGTYCITGTREDGDAEEEEADAIPDMPAIEAGPDPITFPFLPPGRSTQRSLTIRNAGGGTLSVRSMTWDSEPVTFTVDKEFPTVAQPLRLEADDEEVFTITYAPLQGTNEEPTITILSNDPIRIQRDIRLDVQEQGDFTMLVEPSDVVEFGFATLEQQHRQTVTISNDPPVANATGILVVERVELGGAQAQKFSLDIPESVSFPAYINSGESIQFDVIYEPHDRTQDNAELQVFCNDVGVNWPHVIPMHGIGEVVEMVVDPQGLDIGGIPAGERRTLYFTVKSTGGINLELGAPDLSDTQNGVWNLELDPDEDGTDNLPATLGPGESVMLAVVFHPRSIESYATTLKLPNNSETATEEVDLTGSGVGCIIQAFPAELDFGETRILEETMASILLQNDCGNPVTITEFAFDTSASIAFGTSVNTPVVQPGQTREISLSYTPLDDGEDDTWLTLHWQDDLSSGSLEPIHLHGEAKTPRIAVSPSTVTFENAQKLPAAYATLTPAQQDLWLNQQIVEVQNPGTAPLTVYSMDMPLPDSDVTLVVETPFIVPPQGAISVPIQYTPYASTSLSLTVRICSDAFGSGTATFICPDSEQASSDLRLVGNVVDPDLRVQPSSGRIDFGFVAPVASPTVCNLDSDCLGGLKCVQIGEGPKTCRVVESVVLKNWTTTAAVVTVEDLGFTPETSEDFTLLNLELHPSGQTEPPFLLTNDSENYLQADIMYFPDGSTEIATGALRAVHDDKDAHRQDAPWGSDYPNFDVLLSGSSGTNRAPVAIAKSPDNQSPEGEVGTRSITVEACPQEGSCEPYHVTFTAASSYDPDEDTSGDALSSYSWILTGVEGTPSNGGRFIGSQTSSLAMVEFTRGGNYLMDLAVTDGHGVASSVTQDSQIRIRVKSDPIAVATLMGSEDTTFTVPLNTDVHLDGSQSYDPDGSLVAYRWYQQRLGDGDAWGLVATGAQPSLRFFEADTYYVKLVVIDDENRQSENEMILTANVEANESIRIELTWSGGGNVDLHWLQPGGGLGGPGDCNVENPTPDWTEEGHGTPVFGGASSDGATPESITHDNPGDGLYKAVAVYTQAGETCGNVDECLDWHDDCYNCGCSCPPFCYILDICCDDCETCTPVWQCNDTPAPLVWRVYVNGSSYPTYTLSGNEVTIGYEGGNYQIGLNRVDGAFQPL